MITERIFVRPGPCVLAINLGSRGAYAFDGRGRFFFANRDGTSYRRSLDNRLIMKRSRISVEGAEWAHGELVPDHRRGFMDSVRGELELTRKAVCSGCATIEGGINRRDRVLDWLDRALAWDHDSLEGDAREFRRIYQRPVILPPDRSLSVVFQITDGCPHDRRVLFPNCGNRPFRAKSTVEFKQHAETVRGFLGADPLHRGAFLSDTYTLTLSVARLREYLNIARTVFPKALKGPTGWFYALLDLSFPVDRRREQWVELAAEGLRRVYLNVETGSPELSSYRLRTIGTLQIRELVSDLHETGIAVGILVRAGTGGERYSDLHTRTTAALLRSLDLRVGDIMYVVEDAAQPSSLRPPQGARVASDSDWTTLLAEQAKAFVSAVESRGQRGPRVIVSSLDQLWY